MIRAITRMLSLLATFFTLAPASTSFIDEANTMGVANMGHGFAVSFSDYDADGDPDLYITNSNSTNRLYENDGAGRFMDVTGQAGLLDKAHFYAHVVYTCLCLDTFLRT